MRKIIVFPSDPLKAYYQKGEIKERYFNPGNLFAEVHVFSPCAQDIEEAKVQELAGKAKLKIYPLKTGISARLPWAVMPWLYLIQRRKVLRLMENIRPDLVRGYGLFYNSYLAVYAAKKLGVPSVVSVHADHARWRNIRESGFGYILYFLLGLPFFLGLEKYILNHADLLIGAYAFALEYVKRHRSAGIELVYNKVYTSRYDLSQKKDNERLVIISVGVHNKSKSPENLIRAVRNLDVRLRLIGSGKLTPKMKKLAADLGIADKLEFISRVPNTEIHQYYLTSDIFALSLTLGGVAIPHLEAMAAGLPIVASKTRWEKTPELVGDIGLIVENSPEGFQAAFRKLLSEPQLRKELGKKAREKALTIDGEIMERKEVSLYSHLLGIKEK